MSQRKNITHNIRQRLSSGYNVTRNAKSNEKYLRGKIDEYESKGPSMKGFIKERLDESRTLLSRIHAKKANARGSKQVLPSGLVIPPGVVPDPGGGSTANWVPKASVANPPKKALDLELNTWIPWEKYNNDIPFKSSVKGIGNGEHKLAEILGTEPNGQNKKYDLDLCLKVKGRDLCTKGEVKEIEKDSSFFPGANGRNAFRQTKQEISSLQDVLRTVLKDFRSMLSSKFIEYMTCYKEKADGSVSKYDLLTMTPDEISQTNLPRLIEVCIFLHEQRVKEMEKSHRTFSSFDIITGEPRQISSSQMYKLCKADGGDTAKLIKILGEELFKRESFLEVTDHPIIKNPEGFQEYLGQFAARLFSDYTLILVNKKKGFYITDNLEARVTIYRITRAYPKFLITFSGKWDDIKIIEAEDDNEKPPEDF